MLFGHNTNVKVGETVYHVQTEDRGAASALIDTTVHLRGRVLHRRTNNYSDLLPLDSSREGLLRKRIDEQHQAVTEELRSGSLQLATPPPEKPSTASKPSANALTELALDLVNAANWLRGKRAHLQVSVKKKHNGEAAGGAHVIARVDGAADASQHSAKADADGQARLDFDMPQLAAVEAALVIEATQNGAKGYLRFALRTKPRVPVASQ